MLTRVLDDAVRAAEEAEIDAEYARAYPDGFEWSDEQKRLHAAMDELQAEAMRSQLGLNG